MAESTPQTSTTASNVIGFDPASASNDSAPTDTTISSANVPTDPSAESHTPSAAQSGGTADAAVPGLAPSSTEEPAIVSSAVTQPQIKRTQTEALGPAIEDANAIASTTSTASVLNLTIQLPTGARHGYKIDERYLTSRKVEAQNSKGEFDPREISSYKLKELILTDWRSEWEPRPSSPSSIRLIYMGKLLEDKKPLKDYNLSLAEPSIIQMTVKPAEFEDDEQTVNPPKSNSIRARTEDVRGNTRCCVVQ